MHAQIMHGLCMSYVWIITIIDAFVDYGWMNMDHAWIMRWSSMGLNDMLGECIDDLWMVHASFVDYASMMLG